MHPVRSAREVGQSEISLISRHGKPQHGPEPAEYTALSLSQSLAQSLPQCTAHKASAWGLPHQLRRLITGAVLAFGFDQGRFLRRQRAVECAGALSYLEQTHLYPVPQVASVHVHICSYRLARLQCQPLVPSAPFLQPSAAHHQAGTNQPDS